MSKDARGFSNEFRGFCSSIRIGLTLLKNVNGSKKLKDIFIDLKIPRENRNNIPILCFDDKISWIVGYKTSQLLRVTKDTKKILKITIGRKE